VEVEIKRMEERIANNGWLRRRRRKPVKSPNRRM
jgi:hypothetical protein